MSAGDTESAAELLKFQKQKYVYPLDCHLGVNELPFKITVRMMTAIAKEAVLASSYQRATEAVREHYGVSISTATVRSVTDFVGSVVFEDDRQRAEAARKTSTISIDKRRKHRSKDDILYIEMDGAMVNTRIQHEDSSWMECKIGIAFHAKDIRIWKAKNGEIRRQITRKQLVGYIGNYKEFQYHVLAMAERFEYQYCAKIVVISDGADWIHTIVSTLFPGAVHILDLSHVKERVNAFGKWAVENDEDARVWIEKINGMIEDSRIDEVLKELEAYKDIKCPSGILNLYTYISNHRTCMDYRLYRESGYFVGSGAAESANKYTMQNRMKLQGMRWNKETGQGMLSLKARLESGCWNEVEPLLRSSHRLTWRFFIRIFSKELA